VAAVVATPIGELVEQVLPSTGVLARDMSPQVFVDALTDLISDLYCPDKCTAGALHHARTELFTMKHLASARCPVAVEDGSRRARNAISHEPGSVSNVGKR
jgi:hypothetical protein